jgi:hypothetical protein
MKMHKLPFILSILAVLSPQASRAAAVPSKLSGVIVMSCVITDAGAKVDEEIHKIDFLKKQVNNEPVEFEISDIKLTWRTVSKQSVPDEYEKYSVPPSVVINRYSGKLESFFDSGVSKRLTVCRVAGARKF